MKKIVPRHPSPDVASMVESIVGCKWSLAVLERVRQGVVRPGAIVRATDGLTTKVLNERLSKMVRFGILRKNSFPEIPPRVEYSLTEFGHRFIGILDQIQQLQEELNTRQVNARLSARVVRERKRPSREDAR